MASAMKELKRLPRTLYIRTTRAGELVSERNGGFVAEAPATWCRRVFVHRLIATTQPKTKKTTTTKAHLSMNGKGRPPPPRAVYAGGG